MWTRLGILSLLAGFFVAVFNALSGFMKADNFWTDLTLSRLAGDHADSIVEAMPGEFLQENVARLMFDVPFWGIIIGLGVLFLVIGMFMRENK